MMDTLFFLMVCERQDRERPSPPSPHGKKEAGLLAPASRQ